MFVCRRMQSGGVGIDARPVIKFCLTVIASGSKACFVVFSSSQVNKSTC